MKQVLPNIHIGLSNAGRVLVVVDDYELCDFIEDHLRRGTGSVPTFGHRRPRSQGDRIALP